MGDLIPHMGVRGRGGGGVKSCKMLVKYWVILTAIKFRTAKTPRFYIIDKKLNFNRDLPVV